MVPGMCSNPEPTDISDLQIAPADSASYLLVQAEIATGVPAGIEQRLRARLGGRAIPSMEVLVCGTRIRSLVRRLDAKAYVAALPSWVDSQIWLDANRDALQSNLQIFGYGEIPQATPEQLLT
jgi:hypothetical protein